MRGRPGKRAPQAAAHWVSVRILNTAGLGGSHFPSSPAAPVNGHEGQSQGRVWWGVRSQHQALWAESSPARVLACGAFLPTVQPLLWARGPLGFFRGRLRAGRTRVPAWALDLCLPPAPHPHPPSAETSFQPPQSVLPLREAGKAQGEAIAAKFLFAKSRDSIHQSR